MRYELSNDQREAVDLCLSYEKVVSVTGGAGTGKTTILRYVHEELSSRGKRCILAAPTGRAAKRIQEATDIRATTIHRLLEFPRPDDLGDKDVKFGHPRRNKDNPLQCDILLLDEASMINSDMWEWLCRAMPTSGKIRLFGDVNQLPPIDKKVKKANDSIFKRCLKKHPAAYLPHNFRSNNDLITSANNILRGSIPTRSRTFDLLISPDPLGALRKVVSDEYHSTDHQVITPKKNGVVGSTKISSILRTKFSLTTDNERIIVDRLYGEDPITLFEGDKIIWTRNDYVLGIMNGELGIIDEISDGTLELIFDDGRHVSVPPSVKDPFGMFYDPRVNIDLAYCMTTHKAQGSEFKSVIYFMTRAQAYMLNRNNFYTGVTRAKESVLVVTDQHALRYSMKEPRT